MADPRRIAAALQYQKSKPDWFDAVPVADAPGTQRVSQPLPMTWMDRLNNLSAGLGTGITNQLEDYRQMVADPVQAAKDIGSAVGTMVQNPSVILESVKAMGQKAGSGAQGLGEVLGENMTLNPRRLAMALSHPKIAEMTVYHGTPHRFLATERNPLGEFDASKIGTGEGAQAYGHGIYVSESPDVAKKYKVANELTQTLIDNQMVDPSDPRFQAAVRISTHGYKDALDMAVRDSQNQFLTPEGQRNQLRLAEQIKALKNNKVSTQTTGSVYHVDLPDEMIDKMLDWDKPLSEQPKAIQDIARQIGAGQAKGPTAAKMKAFIAGTENPEKGIVATGQDLYRAISDYGGESVAGSKALREAGIPGIRYLDAGSRGTGAGTRNFVVFPGEEKNLKILGRNGEKAEPQKIADALTAMPSQKADPLQQLKNDAKNAGSFENFKKGWIADIKHGKYYHVTENPNFEIKQNVGPRDMSSMSSGKQSVGSLMITSDPSHWAEYYGQSRPYISEIDVSKIPYQDLKQTNRGMGNEFFIQNAKNARILKTGSVEEMLKEHEEYMKKLPQNEAELRKIYEEATAGKK